MIIITNVRFVQLLHCKDGAIYGLLKLIISINYNIITVLLKYELISGAFLVSVSAKMHC